MVLTETRTARPMTMPGMMCGASSGTSFLQAMCCMFVADMTPVMRTTFSECAHPVPLMRRCGSLVPAQAIQDRFCLQEQGG